MSLYTLDVARKDSGKIWHRKPTSNKHDGLLTTITHSSESKLSAPLKNVRFLHCAFDGPGERFVAADYQGNIYLFDLHQNRFSLVQKTGSSCTALAFALRRRTEFIVAMSDYSLKCFDTESKELVAWMKGHSTAIHTLSVHSSGRYALSSSSDTAQLWDLDTFQRKRKLNIKENVGIVKVFFLPMSNTIMTCFKDDSIFAWESDTLNCKYQLHVPEGKPPKFKTFTATRDGHYLVAGGCSRNLYVWTLETRQLLRVVQMPKKVTAVKHLDFLPDSFDGGANQILGVLCQDGIMRFINIHTCKLIFDIGSHDVRITNVSLGPTGRHVVCVLDTGDIRVYSVQALTQEVNKPPAPLVKVMKGNISDVPSTLSERNNSKVSNTSMKNASMKTKLRNKENIQPQDVTEEKLNQDGLPEGMNMDKLTAILKGYGEYPAKYRMFIWRSLNRLPENHTAYAALVDKGTHPAYEKLHEKFPIKSRKLLRVLQRSLSALAHWSPIFGETDFLPMVAFPFIKLFQNNQLVCFEIVATFIVNWCEHWFEYFPNPPINVLGMVENLLAFHDRDLLQHFIRHGITSQTYAWPLLETVFSEILTREEWLKLFDHVFSLPPGFVLAVIVAYCSCSRAPLMKCAEMDDFTYFFHHRNAVDVGAVIKEAYRIVDNAPEDVNPVCILPDFHPLTKGQYPVFNKYPKFIVDYQVQERERIRLEEIEFLRQRQVSQTLERDTERRVQEEEGWYRQQQLLRQAEEKRRKMLATEEQKLLDQRTRLAALNRELKAKELNLMDATRRKFLLHQQQTKEAELARMDDEIRRKATMRDVETNALIEDAEVRNMELQLQKKLFEQELHREFLEKEQLHRHDLMARQKQKQMEDYVSQGLHRAERERETELRKNFQQQLAHVDMMKADIVSQKEVESRQRMDEQNMEDNAQRLAQYQAENRELENDVHEMMRKLQIEREDTTAGHHADYARQRSDAEAADTRRITALEGEVLQAREHVSNIEQSQDQMFERLRDLRQTVNEHNISLPRGGATDRAMNPNLLTARLNNDTAVHGTLSRGAQHPGATLSMDVPLSGVTRSRLPGDREDGCINDTDSELSTQFSLDRGREDFEDHQRTLMSDVRKLRQKLARESREKRPPLHYET